MQWIRNATLNIAGTTRRIPVDSVFVAAGEGTCAVMQRCDDVRISDYCWNAPAVLAEATGGEYGGGVYQLVGPGESLAAIATDHSRVIIAGEFGMDASTPFIRDKVALGFGPSVKVLERLECNRVRFSRHGRSRGSYREPDVASSVDLGGTIGNLFVAYTAKLGLFLRCGELAMAKLRDHHSRSSVLVVGGGVAGVEIARRATAAGHRVTLVEKCPRLHSVQSSRLGNHGRLWRAFGIVRGESTSTVLGHLLESQRLVTDVRSAVRPDTTCVYSVCAEQVAALDLDDRLNVIAREAKAHGIPLSWVKERHPGRSGHWLYNFGASGDGVLHAEGLREWQLRQLDDAAIHYNAELLSVD